MPNISAFGGYRYDPGHVGNLEKVFAPPYDVIDRDFQDQLYQQHPANVIRLILNREEPGDEPEAKYRRAARFLKNWRQEGILQQEPNAAVYVYHQVFEFAGSTFARRGFICRVELERFGEGTIYPHEQTHASAKQDRLLLMRACHANLSPVFGIYPDPDGQAQEVLESRLMGVIPIEARDHLGVIHRLWPVSDIRAINQVANHMASLPTYIADGHHRYETACNYRDELAAAGKLTPTHAANHVMMMCVGMHDPGMIVLPTHRLFRGIQAITSDQLQNQLGDWFDTRVAGEGPELAESLWEQLETEESQSNIALYCQADDRWVLATLNQAGEERMEELASDHCSDWRQLGVSILHRLIVETCLGYSEIPKPKYVHTTDELIRDLHAGDTEQDGSDFQLAALVMPATLDHIRSISEQGDRMPAKSTYFYPKLLSGLVLHLHD